MLPQLRCPWCNSQGLSHIGSHLIEQTVIIYCQKCMAIRGVIPLIGTPPPSQTNPPLRCPWCNATNTEQLKIAPLGKGWQVISCQCCGAMHGVIPLVEPKPAIPKTEPQDLRKNPGDSHLLSINQHLSLQIGRFSVFK